MALQSLCLPASALKSPSSVSDFASSEFLCGQEGLHCSLLLFARSPVPSRRFGGGRRTVVRGKLPKKDPGYGLKDYGIPSYKTPSYGIPKPPFKSTTKKSVEAPVVGKGSSSSSSKLETPSFWNYAAPGDYNAPGNYAAPKAYAAPSGYGPNGSVAAKVAVVEVEAGEVAAGLEGVSPEYQDASVNAELIEVEPELGGGDGGAGKEGGGGGGGGDRGKGDGKGEGEGEGEKQPEKKMSMSQKLTLAYAALVGVGGVIGFAKSGSAKSLVTGGGAALALYYVYAQLPVNPVFASSFGLGISAVLLGIMGRRFKKSGKFMPAGLVALFSLIMTGGYLHGIMRSH